MATLDDCDTIIEIEEACFNDPWDSMYLKFEIAFSKSSRYYVIEVDGKIIGYGGTCNEGFKKRVATIAILPEYQSLGYGKELFTRMIEDIRIKDIILEVDVENKVAKKMYEEFGFVVIDYLDDYYQDHHDAYRMERKKDIC